MKLRKQIKNRVVAVAMLAVVLLSGFWSLGVTNSYAIDKTNRPFLDSVYTYGSVDVENRSYNLYNLSSFSGRTVSFYQKNDNDFMFVIGFISKDPSVFKCVETDYSAGNKDEADKGKFSESTRTYNFDNGSFVYNGTTYYIGYRIEHCYLKPNPYYTYFGKLGCLYNVKSDDPEYLVKKYYSLICDYIANRVDPNICTITCEGDDISTDESTWPGNQDNPIPDENIGTLVLKKSKCYWVKDGSMDVSQRVQWANKTDTDFSLTNNKYAITRIEIKIGNRVTYFGDVEHHGTGKKVDNFGKVYPFKYVIATDNPHDFSFKDMLSASKTDLTKYNAAMLEHEYDLYFRVVCGTAYGTSAEWHCGNWTRYRVTDDPKQDGKNESDNGHFNDNGEWEKDKDTDVDSGGIGNVDDKDDVEDDFNNFKDSENWKDWLNKEGLDLDSAKTFIDQVADVPKMIGDLFSFFPAWVKYSFALGFALIPVIIVIKFLRG